MRGSGAEWIIRYSRVIIIETVAMMHQIRFWLGLHPDTAGGAHTAPSGLLAGF